MLERRESRLRDVFTKKLESYNVIAAKSYDVK